MIHLSACSTSDRAPSTNHRFVGESAKPLVALAYPLRESTRTLETRSARHPPTLDPKAASTWRLPTRLSKG